VRSGLKVVLISRSADKLKSVEAELKAKSPVRVQRWRWRKGGARISAKQGGAPCSHNACLPRPAERHHQDDCL